MTLKSTFAKAACITLVSLASASAHAGWGGGFFACKKTPIADVTDLTITEGAAALGLDTLASVLPPEIAELLDNSEDITVFAPTDEAFENIPGPILGEIVDDPDILATVLSYHVTPYKVDPRKTRYIREVKTLAGQSLFVSRDRKGFDVNQSEIECQGYRTKNGLVWVIDSVLLPQF